MNIGIDIDNTLTNTSIVSNTLVKQDILYQGVNDYHDLNNEDKKDFLSKYLEQIVWNVNIKDDALDVLKYFLKPTGPFFFGFTLNAMLSGIIYGSILYRKPVSWKRILIAKFLVKLFINCVLGTYWLSMLYGNAFLVLLPARLLKNVIMLPIDCVILYFTLNYIGQAAKQFGFVKNKIIA